MASRYPPASWRPLGPQTEPPMRSHDIVCVHTMVGYLTSTDRYFRSGNGAGFQGTESHYGVGGPWGSDAGKGLDGAVWQWQDRARTADANYQDPYRVISIETADNAPRYASSIERWSAAQAASLVELIAWECSTAAHADCPSSWTCHREGIPPRLIPDTKPGRRGLGYHAQGVPGNGLVPGGVAWSKSRGKECPGTARIAQYKNEIIPAVQRRLAGGRAPTPGKPVDPAPGMAEYPVQPGDTLVSIAKRAYGDPDCWVGIRDANPKTLSGSSRIAPGMTLWLPKEEDMPLTPDDIEKVAARAAEVLLAKKAGRDKTRVEYLLAGTNVAAHGANNGVAALAKAVAEQGGAADPDAFVRQVTPALVEAVAEPLAAAVAESVGERDGLTPAQIEAIAEGVLRRVLGEVGTPKGAA